METEASVDWVKFYRNYSQYNGLRGVDDKDLSVLREDMTTAWSHLAQSQGLEVAIKSLRDSQLHEVLLPTLASWDNLIDHIDKRVCSESITLVNGGTVIKWFSAVQGILCVLFLFPCLWPVISKFCICQIVKKGKNRYLYINKSPELGGQIPPPIIEGEREMCEADAKSEQYVTSYMILHVKSVAADWLPNNIKSKVRKESKETRASRELFETLCKKLRKYEDEYEAAVKRHLDETVKRRSHCEESGWSRFRRWCSHGMRLLTRSGQGKTSGDEGQALTFDRDSHKRQLRRTYSAIPAQEYEKDGMINLHLIPATPKPSSSYVKESASLFNLR